MARALGQPDMIIQACLSLICKGLDVLRTIWHIKSEVG